MKAQKTLLSLLTLPILCILIGTIFVIPLTPPQTTASAGTQAQFAQILPGAILYSRTNSGFVPITGLPPDYFVLITDRSDPEFFAVAYHDLLGFVRRATVLPVSFEPVTISALGTLTSANDGLGVHLRERPDHTHPNPVFVPSGTQLAFYGTLTGTTLHPLLGNSWYFVRHNVSGNTIFGYVFGGHIEVTTPIPPNEILAQGGGGGGVYEYPYRPPFELDSIRQAIVIASLAVAAVFVMLSLYRPSSKQGYRAPRHIE